MPSNLEKRVGALEGERATTRRLADMSDRELMALRLQGLAGGAPTAAMVGLSLDRLHALPDCQLAEVRAGQRDLAEVLHVNS